MKVSGGSGEGKIVEVTVYDYFINSRKIELTWSAHVPCLDVGKPKRPNYLPVEVCKMISYSCCFTKFYKQALF